MVAITNTLTSEWGYPIPCEYIKTAGQAGDEMEKPRLIGWLEVEPRCEVWECDRELDNSVTHWDFGPGWTTRASTLAGGGTMTAVTTRAAPAVRDLPEFTPNGPPGETPDRLRAEGAVYCGEWQGRRWWSHDSVAALRQAVPGNVYQWAGRDTTPILDSDGQDLGIPTKCAEGMRERGLLPQVPGKAADPDQAQHDAMNEVTEAYIAAMRRTMRKVVDSIGGKAEPDRPQLPTQDGDMIDVWYPGDEKWVPYRYDALRMSYERADGTIGFVTREGTGSPGFQWRPHEPTPPAEPYEPQLLWGKPQIPDDRSTDLLEVVDGRVVLFLEESETHTGLLEHGARSEQHVAALRVISRGGGVWSEAVSEECRVVAESLDTIGDGWRRRGWPVDLTAIRDAAERLNLALDWKANRAKPAEQYERRGSANCEHGEMAAYEAGLKAEAAREKHRLFIPTTRKASPWAPYEGE